MSRPRVFVVNEPLRRERLADGSRGPMTRFMNLVSAEEYGDLTFLLPPGKVPNDPVAIIEILREKLATFSARDYIIPVGDMIACTLAVSIAVRKTDGRVNLLRWSTDNTCYTSVAVDLERA